MQSFIRFFIEKKQFTLILIAALLVLGVNSLMNMPKGEDPDINMPIYSVVVIVPGASPSEIVEQVIKPIENKFNEMENIDEITSVANSNLAFVTIQYEYHIDRDEKYQEIIREMEKLRSESLPQSVNNVIVKHYKSTDVNIFQIALTSHNAPYNEMEKHAEDLKEKLERVSGIKRVETHGYPEQEVHVEMNVNKLSQYGISLNKVVGILKNNSYKIPAGSVVAGTNSFNVETGDEFKTLAQIENIIIEESERKIIRLKDIADIRRAYAEEKHRVRLNGVPAVIISVNQNEGQNIFKVSEAVGKVIDEFSEQLPPNMEVNAHFEQAKSVGNRLSRLGTDFLIAILFVSITLLPLGFRSSSVVMVSIPLSIAIGLFLLNMLGYSINQFSIVGLILALGILVDDSIVIVENIQRGIRNGLSRKEAAIQSTGKIAFAVIGVTAILIIAFVPLLRMPEIAGEYIRSLPLAVMLAVSASLFVSLTIIPFLSTLMLKKEIEGEGNFFLRGLNKGIHYSYGSIMDKALKYPGRATLIVAVITLAGFFVLPSMGFSLFPKTEKPQFYINVEMAPNSSFDETDRVTSVIENILGKEDGIEWYTNNIGEGNPQVYYNVFPQNEKPGYANFFIQLEENAADRKQEIIYSLREQFQLITGAKVMLIEYEQGPPMEAPVAIRLFGENIDTLRIYATQIEEIVKGVEGTLYVNNPLATVETGLKLNINKEKAAFLNIGTEDINTAVVAAISGINAGEIQFDDKDDKSLIKVMMPKDKFQTMEIFGKIYVPSLNGTSVPLSHVAEIVFQKNPTILTRLNKENYTTITAYGQDGYLYNKLNKNVSNHLSLIELPKGYYWEAAGDEENQSRAFAGFGTTLLITIFAFVAALILEFKSFKSTLIVLSVIPLGAMGGILGLFLSGNPLSFVAIVGFIALIGIEIKNSILLVDYTNQLREEGMELDKAVKQAGEVRFIPILLTAITSIVGMIPLIWENSQLYSPLAIVIVGGLISSLLLSRILTPVLYKMLPPEVKLRF